MYELNQETRNKRQEAVGWTINIPELILILDSLDLVSVLKQRANKSILFFSLPKEIFSAIISGAKTLRFRSAKFAVGGWQRAVGRWQLAVGDWQLAIGN